MQVYILFQRSLDDDGSRDVAGVYRTLQGAIKARAGIWAEEDFQEIYGGTEHDVFRIEEWLLGENE